MLKIILKGEYFCVCADDFQDLSKAFSTIPYTILTFYLLLLIYLLILKILTETLLRTILSLAAGKMRKN